MQLMEMWASRSSSRIDPFTPCPQKRPLGVQATPLPVLRVLPSMDCSMPGLGRQQHVVRCRDVPRPPFSWVEAYVKLCPKQGLCVAG